MDTQPNSGIRGAGSGGSSGTVIIPFLFLLSLLSLLSVTVIKVGGSGSAASEALIERSQARMAALSGVEIAYRRLTTDLGYRGEICTPFQNPACSIDITVNDLGDSEYEVIALGMDEGSEAVIRTRARASEYAFRYPLCVGNNLELKGKSGILCDVYVENQVSGKTSAVISGSIYLDGSRTFFENAVGEVIAIDGVETPKIKGETYDDAPKVVFPSVDLSNLYDLAAAAGQVFTGTTHFENQCFTGVVYIDGAGSHPYFDNVTIKGTLVCDGVPELRVESGLLKIHADETLCPNTALLAPDTDLWVDPNAFIDIYGLSYFKSVDFQGGGTFTGPVIVRQDMTSLPNSYFYCQFPSSMRDFAASSISWGEPVMVELAYEEL